MNEAFNHITVSNVLFSNQATNKSIMSVSFHALSMDIGRDDGMDPKNLLGLLSFKFCIFWRPNIQIRKFK